jgi:phospholipid/cholesterol/gamma-HCH transport system substrate-binding protein
MRLKNEVMVGGVVLLGLIITLIGAFWLSGRQWGLQEREIVAIFKEAGDLRVGNPVKYRGVTIGRTSQIELSPRGDGVYVTSLIDASVELPADAAMVLSPAGLFGDWQAQIVSFASLATEMDFAQSTSPDVLPGTAMPDISQLTAVAARIAGDIETLSRRFEVAFTEETAIKLRQTIENVQEISAQLTGFVDQQTGVYRDVSSNVLAATENIRGATVTAERIAVEVGQAFQPGGQVALTLGNVREASENLRELSVQLSGAAAGVPALVTRADAAMASIGGVADDLGGVLRGLEPQLAEVGPTLAEGQAALAALRRVAQRLEEGDGTIGRLLEDPALYEETQASIATLRRLLADIQANPQKYLRGAVRVF